ncbi:MAG: phenylacetate--CoA ligase family protein [Acidobacteria bacterium]|nr:MAG: phenylacetate--CoA ligase family protein [Acidobacteriota bacterium]
MAVTREQIAQRQLEKLNLSGSGLALLRKQNTFYRKKLESVTLPISSLEVFLGMPFTTKQELVDDQADNPPYGTNLTFEHDAYTRIHATSGTTGRRLTCLDTNESWAWFTFCWQEIYRAIGITREDRIFTAFGFGPFVGFWAGYEAAQQIGALAIPGGAQSSEQRLHWLMETRATVLLSTPTYALRLIEVAREKNIDLRTSAIRNTIHAGEPGANVASIRKQIESAWGARCWDHAGMSEVGAWGYQCPDDQGLHLLESEFIAEVLSVDTGEPVAEGEPGELILTNLGRWAMPALRYRTGDVVKWVSTPCTCGSPFVRFPGGILGRVDDMIQVRGVNVYPSAVESIIREAPAVVEFQVEISKERGMWELHIDLEVAPGADSEAIRAGVAEALGNQLGIRATIELAEPSSLPRYELKARRFRFKTEKR